MEKYLYGWEKKVQKNSSWGGFMQEFQNTQQRLFQPVGFSKKSRKKLQKTIQWYNSIWEQASSCPTGLVPKQVRVQPRHVYKRVPDGTGMCPKSRPRPSPLLRDTLTSPSPPCGHAVPETRPVASRTGHTPEHCRSQLPLLPGPMIKWILGNPIISEG